MRQPLFQLNSPEELLGKADYAIYDDKEAADSVINCKNPLNKTVVGQI